jgi:hypothetical protein
MYKETMPVRSKVLPDTYTFFLAAIVGLALGGVLSAIFGRFVLPTKIPFEFTVGGISTGLVLTNLLLIAVVTAIVFLGYVSMVVQDTAFPQDHPWLFIAETLIVALVPASVIYVMTDFRDNGKVDFPPTAEYALLAAKFAIFHLLFQFSGIYSYMFKAN